MDRTLSKGKHGMHNGEQHRHTGGLAVNDQDVGHLSEFDIGRSLLDLFEKFSQCHFTPGGQGQE